MSLPFEINEVPEDLNRELLAAFTGQRGRFLQVGPKKYFFSSEFKGQVAGFYNMEVRPDDVWVVTFPRTGTTLVQEMIWLINNDFDYETAIKILQPDRFPFIDLSTVRCEAFIKEIVEINNMNKESEEVYRNRYAPGYEKAEKMKSPRHIKSHLPLSLLPPKLLDTCKVVYVARNPKDVAVSYYYHNKFLKHYGFEDSFEKYWDLFQRGLVIWSPFWSHVEEAWQRRDHPNLHFVFYEDLKKDLPGEIQKMAAFLNKSIPEEQMDKLVNHLSIENFRKNPSIKLVEEDLKGVVQEDQPGFIRQGKSGGWRNEFSPELNAKADEWIREHEKHTDLRFQM